VKVYECPIRKTKRSFESGFGFAKSNIRGGAAKVALKMEKKSIHNIIIALTILLALSTSLMIYLSNFKSSAFDRAFYEEQFQENRIRERFDSSVNLTYENERLLNYLENGEGEIQSEFFNTREKTHLVEVRELFKKLFTLLNMMFALSLISALALVFLVRKLSMQLSENDAAEYYKKTVARMLTYTGTATNAIAIFFAFVALTFSTSFVKFHLIFFKTDTWMLDPATDNLIRMFPEQFFMAIFIKIILASVVAATIMMVIGFVMKMGRPRIMQKQ
jgi:integral membrane protein (TIGR01906 family)